MGDMYWRNRIGSGRTSTDPESSPERVAAKVAMPDTDIITILKASPTSEKEEFNLAIKLPKPSSVRSEIAAM